MNLDNLTLGQIKELQNLVATEKKEVIETFFEVGKIYLIRTVTMFIVGRLVAYNKQELHLTEASWIADTGRFSSSLLDAKNLKEIEPFKHNAIVGRGGLIDATILDVKLPLNQK